jgi:ribose transport system substrate-binding protein
VKKVVLILLILIIGLMPVMAQGQKSDSAQDGLPEEIVLGWSPPDVTGVFATATEYMEMAAEDARKNGLNVEIITQSPASHTDFGSQVAVLEDFVARNVDAIIVSPSEVDIVIPAIRAANDAGIPVIVVNLLEPIEGIDVASYIGFSNVDAGLVSGYAVLDYLGGPGVLGEGESVDAPEFIDKDFYLDLYEGVSSNEVDIEGKVAIIEGIAGGFFSRQRVDGFHMAIDSFPDVEVLATLPADWNREKAVGVTEDILQSQNELDVIWAASNEMGIGATYPLAATGRDKEVVVVTNDGTPESIDLIREGKILAETWHGFPEWGWYGVRFAVMKHLGQDIPQQFDIRPRIAYKDNADNFYPNVELEAHPWDEIIETYLSR